MDHEAFYGEKGKYPVDCYVGHKLTRRDGLSKLKSIDNYLPLHSSTLKTLLTVDANFGIMFPFVIRALNFDGIEVVYPIHKGNYSERVFLWCEPDKTEPKFDYRECTIIPFLLSNLTLCVDVKSSNYVDELIELFPDLVKYPKFIQNKLSKIPEQFSNMPERLKCLIDAYEMYWVKVKPNNNAKENIIDDDVEKFIKASFASASEPYNKNRDSDNKLVPGKKLVAFAAKTIEPEFIKSSSNRIEKSISDGVPTKFWILLCAAQYFWKNVDRGDIDSHPEGKHIEKVLTCFGKEHSFKHARMDAGKWVNTTPYQDALEDFRQFISQFPEIKHFSEVSFKSDYKYAASIIRPFWAKAKNTGGDKYGEAKSKGRENYIRVHPQK